VADKLTQQITDALLRAAAEPAGLPLYVSKSDPGLFPATTVGRPAAQKCLVEGLLRAVTLGSKSKSPRDLYTLSEAGWNYLLAQVNPKQVLEDFVRVLEARSGEVGELLDTAKRMADSLQGLKEAVARVLPSVVEGRVRVPFSPNAFTPRSPHPEGLALTPRPPLPGGEGEEDHREVSGRSSIPMSQLPLSPGERGPGGEGLPEEAVGVALLDATEPDLAQAILTHLSDWPSAAGEDCPLPELFRSLADREPSPSIGEFHDALRQLHAAGDIYLHPWTGPLYAVPEPSFALLAGHNIAYYASSRESL
jgi:hypothetical protein